MHIILLKSQLETFAKILMFPEVKEHYSKKTLTDFESCKVFVNFLLLLDTKFRWEFLFLLPCYSAGSWAEMSQKGVGWRAGRLLAKGPTFMILPGSERPSQGLAKH